MCTFKTILNIKHTMKGKSFFIHRQIQYIIYRIIPTKIHIFVEKITLFPQFGNNVIFLEILFFVTTTTLHHSHERAAKARLLLSSLFVAQLNLHISVGMVLPRRSIVHRWLVLGPSVTNKHPSGKAHTVHSAT